MDLQDKRRIAAALRAELAQLEPRAQYLRNLIQGFDGLIALEEQTGQAGSPDVEEMATALVLPQVASRTLNGVAEAPKTKEAVLRILGEDPGRTWPLAEIIKVMEERSWLSGDLRRPIEAVRAAANRLAEVEKQIQRIGASSYRMLQSQEAMPQVEEAIVSQVEEAVPS